ncbi:MAG: type IX secretion system protein PorQ [Bacteroidales bacterium]|nr:type IX secretion system protein PorQ [Bacteroidales bacterium]
MKHTRIIAIAGCFALLSDWAVAQEVGEYGFLQLPVSSHAAALGGTVVSVVEPEAGLAYQNPALLCPEMSGQAVVSYMNYVSDINLSYASYTGSFRTVGAWQAGVQYLSYGDFEGYDSSGVPTGSFTAKDIALYGSLGLPINDNWRWGVTARAVISKYESYSAFALGVDAGLNYYDEVAGRSISLVVSNLGGQLKSLDESRKCNLPTQLSIGWTKEVEHLPFCFTLTAYNLFDWEHNYYDAEGKLHKYKGGEQLLNHLLWGVEWVASDNFYLAAGYSYRRQSEFSGDGGFLRGLSVGGGLNWRQWKAGASYASYNAVDGSLMFQLSYTF